MIIYYLVTEFVSLLSGVANISVTDSQIPLTGPNSIIGRAVVVHADPDDLGKGNDVIYCPHLCLLCVECGAFPLF